MKDEMKEIIDKLRSDDYYEKKYQKSVYYERDLKKLEDCIANLQEELKSANESITWWQNRFNVLQEENERLKEIAHKMHLWIFLHSGDEQKVYDELGLTDEENDMLGYSGQFRIGGDENENI